MRHHLCAACDHRRQHVGAKVGARLVEPRGKCVGAKGVDTHAGKATGRALRLLLEAGDVISLIDVHHTHATRIVQAHLAHSNGDIGTTAAVGGNEALVVHLVDVIASEHEYGLSTARHNLAQILQHCVSRAAIPARRVPPADLRLQDSYATDRAIEIPGSATADMVVERARVVLRQDQHVTDSAVHAV